jgi:E3 ubiquitin-protein ligase UBR3
MQSDEHLGQQYEDIFAEMSRHFDPSSSLLSTHRGWKGGVHIQSCGHHMHYDCRQSYCETLKQLMRVTREQVCGNYIFAIYVEILSHIS